MLHALAEGTAHAARWPTWPNWRLRRKVGQFANALAPTHDDELDRTHDYTAKAGAVHSEILLPDGAPGRWLDREML